MHRSLAFRAALAGAFALQTIGCRLGSHELLRAPIPERALPRRQQVVVYTGGERRLFHAVEIRRDTVSAVYHIEPPDCESCRIYWPGVAVDSMELVPSGEAGAAMALLALPAWIIGMWLLTDSGT